MTASVQDTPSAHHPGSSTSTSRVATETPKPGLIRRRVPFLFSVRFGLTAWYAGVLILTLAIAGFGLRILLVRSIESDVEARLNTAARTVLVQTSEKPNLSSPDRLPSIVVPDDLDVQPLLQSNLSVTIVDATNGAILFQRGGLSSLWPEKDAITGHLGSTSRDFVTVQPRGTSIRGLVVPVSADRRTPNTGEPLIIGYIFVSESLENQSYVITRLNQLLAAAGLAGVAIASLGGWLLAGRALAPVNRLMTSVDEIASGSAGATLSRRVDVPATGDEIAQLAETFNDMLDRIEETFAAQQRFVGDASHELRTPLTSIKGNIDVLRRQVRAGKMPDREDLVDALGDVSRESDRMGRLVDDLLSLARNDATGFGSLVSLDAVSLDVLAREAVRTAEVLVEGQTLRLDASTPVMVQGDGDRLVQVMLILIDNALRHTPAGGTVTLGIRTAVDPLDMIPCAIIDVDDNGKGIAGEHLPHLFERFYRAEGSRSRLDGGTGLGLSIALSIVRSHGGWIDVESAPERGTHFTIWLPLPQEEDTGEGTTSRLRSRLPRLRSRNADAAAD